MPERGSAGTAAPDKSTPTATSASGSTGPERERRLRIAIAATALVATAGLGIVGTTASTLGSVLVLLGTVALMYAIHRFGRLGPDADPL